MQHLFNEALDALNRNVPGFCGLIAIVLTVLAGAIFWTWAITT